MKKRVIVILVIALLAMTMLLSTGCELAPVSNIKKPIEISEDLTLDPPEGLEYDNRVVLTMECTSADNYGQMGVTTAWIIVYANGTDYIGLHSAYVFKDQASLDAVKPVLGADPSSQTKGLTLWAYGNAETLAGIKLYYADLDAYLGIYYNQGFTDYVIE